MGKQIKGWIPPDDAEEVHAPETPIEKINTWVPPTDAEEVPLKKKEDTTSDLNSEDNSKTPGSEKSTGASEQQKQPLPKSLEKLNTRVGSLNKFYQNQFEDSMHPHVQEQQKLFENDLSGKKSELEGLLKNNKISAEDANKQLSEYANTRKQDFDNSLKESATKAGELFQNEHKAETDKFLGMYNQDYQKEATKENEVDFQKNKETNPLKSFYKTAWSTMSQDIPSSAYAAKALMQSAANKSGNAFDNMLPKIDPELSDKVSNFLETGMHKLMGVDEDEIKLHKEGLSPDATNKQLIIDDLMKASNYQNASNEQKKYIVNSLDKVKDGDYLDMLNYTASASGQGVGYIPASIGTHGATSLVQEMGSIYLDAVNKTAEEESKKTGKTVTIQDVINSGKDNVVFPIIFGLGAGLLDAFGANKVAGSFSKQQIMNSFRKRVMDLTKTVGTEAITEGSQGALENLGVDLSGGKSLTDAIKNTDLKNIKESALQGAIGAGSMGGVAHVGGAINSAATSNSVQIHSDNFKVSLPDLINQKLGEIKSTADLAGISKIADAVMAKVKEEPQTAIDKTVSSEPTVPTNVITPDAPSKAESTTASPIQSEPNQSTQEGQPTTEPSSTVQQPESSTPPTEGKTQINQQENENNYRKREEISGTQNQSQVREGSSELNSTSSDDQQGEGNQGEEEVKQFSKFTPKNKEGAAQVFQHVFDLPEQQAKDVAEVHDVLMQKIADRTGTTKEEQYANNKFVKGDEELAKQLKDNPGLKYQTELFHSSPYQFDKFSAEAIGSGVGKQKFGYGFYFLDKPGPTKGYATLPFATKILPQYYNQFPVAKTLAQDFGGDIEEYKKDLEVKSKKLFGAAKPKAELKQLNALEQKLDSSGQGKYTYTVDVHQGKTPQQYDYLKANDILSPEQAKKIGVAANLTGQQAYEELQKKEGSDKAASMALLKKGIDGMIYPSSDLYKGDTTSHHNVYVVFDPKAISIKQVAKFQEEMSKAKGAQQTMGEQSIIYALTNPDVSTPLHELAHVYENYLTDQERKDILNWTGEKSWKTNTSEKFARGFENYLREGKAPNSQLQEAFDNFKKWLTDIYNGLKSGSIDFKLSPEMQKIYDEMLTTSKDVEATESNQNGYSTGERATINKMAESGHVGDKVKTGVEEFSAYQKKTNQDTLNEANHFIDQHGEDEAMDIVNDKFRSVLMTQLEKTAIQTELFKRFNDKFNQTKSDADFNKIMTLTKGMANNFTDTAQALQFMSVLGNILENPATALRFAKNQIEGSAAKSLRNYKAEIENAGKIFSEYQNQSKEELLNSESVKKLIAELEGNLQAKIQEEVNKRLEKTKLISQEKRKQISDFFDSIKADVPKGMAMASILPVPQLYNAAIDVIKTAVLTGADVANAIQAGIDYIKSQTKEPFDEKAFTDGIAPGLQQVYASKPLTETEKVVKGIVEPKVKVEKSDEAKIKEQERKSVRDKIDSEINKSVDEFNKGNKNAYKELSQRLINDLKVSKEQAQTFAKKIEEMAEARREEVKNKLIKKYSPKKQSTEGKKKTQFYQKILELSEKGALSEDEINEQISTIFGLPEMTKEIAEKVQEFVEKVKAAPEGQFKNRESIKMLDYISMQQKFNMTDYMIGSYKAGIFSGVDTQILNNLTNFFGGITHLLETALFNPMEAFAMTKAIVNPTGLTRGLNEARLLMQTGIDPRFVDEANRRQLEQRKRSFWGFAKGLSGKMQALDPSLEQQKKYVFRALSAGDIVATTTVSDMAQTTMFRRLGLKDKGTHTSVDSFVKEQMGLNEDQQQQALEQAEQEYDKGVLGEFPEGLKNAVIKSRKNEIIEQSRNPEVVQRARELAQDQMFVAAPKGYIGIFANSLNTLIRKIPILNALVPVVNIGANITQRGIQYFPPAAIVRGIAHYLPDIIDGVSIKSLIKEDIQKIKIDPIAEKRFQRFLVSSAMMVAIMALTEPDDDDDDNLISKLLGQKIRLHGSGPGKLGNMAKSYQKQETGWKPYSMQIGDKFFKYDMIPGYNVLFASMGEYHDAVRYGKMKKKDAQQRLGYALANSPQVLLKNSLFQSVTGNLEALFEGNDDKFSSALVVNPLSGFLVPKFQRNLLNLFDDNVYNAKGFVQLATRSVPILNGYTNEEKLNALGEPIHRKWWERVELWNSSKHEKETAIWNDMDVHNYSLPMPSQAALAESIKHDVSPSDYGKFYKYRGEEIKKLYSQMKLVLDEIKDPEIYKKTFDTIVDEAGFEAKHRLGASNGWKDVESTFTRGMLYEFNKQRSKIMPDDLKQMRKSIKPKF